MITIRGKPSFRTAAIFSGMAGLLICVGLFQSWSVALTITNLCIISAIMALGVNIQWGYAGLFNAGVMGFAALGGLAAALISAQPVPEAWSISGFNLFLSVIISVATIATIIGVIRFSPKGKKRLFAIFAIGLAGFFLIRIFYDPAIMAIEAVNPAQFGYLGGAGLPIILSWPMGGVLAAIVAWMIGKISLGLRSDYLAIATLGISEIIIAILKNEDWLTRGVKNITGLPRPVPFEINLQKLPQFIEWVEWFHSSALARLAGVERAEALQKMIIESSTLFVKLCYMGLFSIVLIFILVLSVMALNSPWGRMMRAIRDNEDAASAMGKNITKRYLQAFILGSAVVGIAGAMLTTLDGQFTPGNYNPLRFTFLIWVMVIVGGSGNNLGSVVGGFLIWFIWIESELVGSFLMTFITSGMTETNAIKIHLLDSTQYMRLIIMGLILLVILRFAPGGLLPERINRTSIRTSQVI